VIGALSRLVAMLVALGLCAAVAVVVYSALGETLSFSRVTPQQLGAPVGGSPDRVVFTVRPGQSASDVGEELQRRGLIRSALAFRWEVESKGLGTKLEAGDYELSPTMSTGEIVAVLGRGAISPGTAMTIPEGWRADQVARHAQELKLASAEEVLRVVRSPAEFGLAPPDPAARSLEGYLFPDTYDFDPQTPPAALVEKLLRQFDRRFNDDLRRRAVERGITIHQVVTIASLVEREAADPAERPLVSAVYQNRLATGMRLDADPTVQYAVANLDLNQALQYGFWKRDLTLEDLKVDSPFNTYRVTGLPPGPICSPGLASLQAVLEPAKVGYLFFVARGDGSHAFADTLDQHNANVARYR
jgi:UPF0755 protein